MEWKGKISNNQQKIWVGAAYYPEAWTDEVIADDIVKMKKIGVNVVRMAEFAWSTMEPEEGKFDFSVFQKVVRKMAENDIDVISDIELSFEIRDYKTYDTVAELGPVTITINN